MHCSLLSVLAIAAVANGATHSVAVGQDGALSFNPDSLTAAVGDQVEFHFYSGSGGHSVVSSTFQSPCVPETDAFFSGYIPGNDAGDTTFIVNVTSTDPIWFYCSLSTHCLGGMSGVVNPPSGESISDYQNAAQSVKAASAPAATGGGVLTTIASGSGSSSTASSDASTTTSASTTTTGASSTTTGASTTTTGTSTTTGSTSTTTSTGSAATTTSANSNGAYGGSTAAREVLPIVMGLSVIMGGLVALMS